MVYGPDRTSAVARARALAVRVLAERLDQGGEEYLPQRANRGSRVNYEAALAEVPDVEPEAYDCLKEAPSRLDPAEEHALAEEGLAADFEAWPEYSDRVREESRLDAGLRHSQRQSINPDD